MYKRSLSICEFHTFNLYLWEARENRALTGNRTGVVKGTKVAIENVMTGVKIVRKIEAGTYIIAESVKNITIETEDGVHIKSTMEVGSGAVSEEHQIRGAITNHKKKSFLMQEGKSERK